MAAKPTLHIGIMAEEVQFTDIAGVDILGNLSTRYVKAISEAVPMGEFDGMATPMVFHYISSSLTPARMSASLYFHPTITYDVAPRDLDILVIGGAPPGFNPPGADNFLKEQKSKVIMTTCVGAMWLASAGGLEGKTATTNRGFLPMAKKLYPDTTWVDKRWAVDGNLWTAGGAGAGIDMFAAFAREKFPEKLVEFLVNNAIDFDDRRLGQFYPDNPLGQAEVGALQVPYWTESKQF